MSNPITNGGPGNSPSNLTVNSLTTRIMNRYDRNGDGKIQLKPGAFNPEMNSPTWTDETHVSIGTEENRGGGEAKLEYRQVSLAPLFQDADTNGDNLVSKAELRQALTTFDRNKNGIIGSSEIIKGSTASELDVLEDSYPETAKNVTVWGKVNKNASDVDKDIATTVYGRQPEKPAVAKPDRIQVIKDRIEKLDAQIEKDQAIIASSTGYIDRRAQRKQAEDRVAAARAEKADLIKQLHK